VTPWKFEFINAEAEEEFLTLPVDIKARLDRIISLITEHGLERIGAPYVKHLRGKLWELRAHGRTGQALPFTLKIYRDIYQDFL
jgi:hypothetical protein